MKTFLVIARKINRHGECDFLTPSSEPRGLFTLSARAAERFATVQAAATRMFELTERNPNDEFSIMDMTMEEAMKPGFWTIADAWQERVQLAQAIEHRRLAKVAQTFVRGALPLFGDQARQMDLMDLMK